MVSLNGKQSMVTKQLSDDQRRRLLVQIPVGRFCEAAKVAHLVRFLVARCPASRPAKSSTSMVACTWIEQPRG